MKVYKKLGLVACTFLVLASCKKTEELNVQQPVGLGGEVISPTAIDKWISDSLTTPYNITALYRWDPWNASLYKTVTPASESRVIPLFSALKRVWIDPYNDETGSEVFIKKYSPKQFILIGSVEYDYYTVTLGQAEGGNSIVFFDVNQNFDKDPVTSVKRVIHTAHHEFAHILHQTVMYPQDFKGTSSKLGLPGYTATWFNVSDADAFAQGYATAYSRASPDEDFVEMVSTMLTEGNAKWEEMKAATNATARQALQQKEDFVVTYFKQVWNINFYSLQTRVQAALTALYPSPLSEYYGFEKKYTTVSVNPANTSLTQQPGFTNIFATAKTGLAGSGVLDSLAIISDSATSFTVRLHFHSGFTSYLADYIYSFTEGANGIYTLSYAGVPPTIPGSNGTFIKAKVQPLLDYFNNTFKIDWYINPNITTKPLRVVFTPQAVANSAFMGLLLP